MRGSCSKAEQIWNAVHIGFGGGKHNGRMGRERSVGRAARTASLLRKGDFDRMQHRQYKEPGAGAGLFKLCELN